MAASLMLLEYPAGVSRGENLSSVHINIHDEDADAEAEKSGRRTRVDDPLCSLYEQIAAGSAIACFASLCRVVFSGAFLVALDSV